MSLAAADLDAALEAHRRELTGYCYRMLGAAADADDAVQETLVRAWRGASGFEGRSSLRTWLYRIAGNVCIDMQRSRQRRALPMDLAGPRHAPDVTVAVPEPEKPWISPIADDKVIDLHGDPADVAAARETIRLAFVAALQHLPARQRSVLILCDVLRWQASEAAELLDTTVASVNSALQRARATLDDVRGRERLDPPDDPAQRELLARYVDAFERYDIPELVTLLRDDVVLSMPPYDLWFRGSEELAHWFANQGAGCAGSRLVPVAVAGTAGFGSYKPAAPGRWEPWAVQVIEVRDGRISGHHNFVDASLFARVGLPPCLEA